MSYGIDKVINEIKGRCGSKFNVDGIQNMIQGMKHPPMPEEGVAVVEIEAEPVVEEHKGEAEEPQLPEGETKEVCPKCNQEPCVCEQSSEEETPAEEETKEEEAVEATGDKLEEATPEEEDRMGKILDAIKTFFPNEDTEDVLVRIVSKLIDK